MPEDVEQLATATPPVEIETGGDPAASVIWLHGLGADGHDFEAVVPQLHLPDNLHVRFVFPHAPPRAVTLNAGLVMRAWYDIALTPGGFWQNPDHICESERIVRVFIERELARGIPASRMVLAGFSQGAAIALHTGLRYSEALAGIMALSGYLPVPERVSQEGHAANKHVPIFMAHGEHDPVVPVAFALESKAVLQRQGYRVEWHVYPMAHAVSPPEIQAIAGWLTRVLRPAAATAE